MDSIWSFLNISMISGLIVGSLLSIGVLAIILLLLKERGKINILSSLVTAVLASFLSLQISFIIIESKVVSMIDEPLELADKGVHAMSKGISVINSGIAIINWISGTNVPQIPETDTEYINKVREDIDARQKNHYIYIVSAILLTGLTLYFTAREKETRGAKSRSRSGRRSEFLDE